MSQNKGSPEKSWNLSLVTKIMFIFRSLQLKEKAKDDKFEMTHYLKCIFSHQSGEGRFTDVFQGLG